MHRIDPILAREIARAGARRLASLVKSDGRFIYEYADTDPPVFSDRYNVLRHCGAVWSLFDVVRVTGPDEAITAAAIKAGHYILQHFIMSMPDFPQWPAVLVDAGKVKLGGAGLAILALTELHRATLDARPLEVAAQLGTYILGQRKGDGDFTHSRQFPSGEVLPFLSNYYTGEALLGLLMLDECPGAETFLEAAFESLLTLQGRDYGVAERHHWLLYALARAYQKRPLDAFRVYATKIADRIIASEDYRAGARSTPISCMSEGLLARLRIPDSPGEPSIRSNIENTIRENFLLQIRSLTPDGAFHAAPDSRVVRIDFIQHSISSFARYYDQYRSE